MNELSCPQCGYEFEFQPPELAINEVVGFELHVVKLGGVTLHRPAVATRNGLYVVGHNEDGDAILTHVPGVDHPDGGRRGD